LKDDKEEKKTSAEENYKDYKESQAKELEAKRLKERLEK